MRPQGPVIRILLVVWIASACSSGTDSGAEVPADAYAANVCVSAKQYALGNFCASAFEAWWEASPEAREATLDQARRTLTDSWGRAEVAAREDGVECDDLAWPDESAAEQLEREVAGVVAQIQEPLSESQRDASACGGARWIASAETCQSLFRAESRHVVDLGADPDHSLLESDREASAEAFVSHYEASIEASCPDDPGASSVLEGIRELVAEAVFKTVVSPGLESDDYLTLTPGPTEYLGRTYVPQCVQGSEYRYFARRGTTNKLLIYYQGGGACWNALTCAIPSCRSLPEENLDAFAADGFFDLDNPDNPFRDWNIVFVSYCSCDIHFGDASIEYEEGDETSQHLGFHNARVAEKWAREHFVNPEVVFVTGSSAGAYGAWFHGPLLHEVWPASQFHVLADAGNGVITETFLQNELAVWNFTANLPDIPGVSESITEGGGIVDYTLAIARQYPETNWAHYSTLYDGSPGGQSGFYNVMLTNGSPTATLRWWDASCAFAELALSQAQRTYEAMPSNYRYYFGTGSAHTVFRNDKVYEGRSGGVPVLVDWVRAMLASGPGSTDPRWTNALCSDCGVILPEDPKPVPLETPFTERGEQVVVECP